MKKNMLICLSLIVVTIAVFVACGSKERNCADEPATYTGEMKAIIDAKCATCHKAGGTAATIGIYTSYATMQPNLDASWEEVKAGRMPKGNKLTDAEKEAWECWQAANFPEN
jgi:cytochrome c553